jgi:hypothetical protein
MGIGSKEVLFNSTENVGQLDLNNMQRFLRAFATDWILGQGGSFHGSGDPGAAGYGRFAALYSIGDSGAPFPTATPLQISNLAGPIGQWVGHTGEPDVNPVDGLPDIPPTPLATQALAPTWGANPYFMVYWLSPDELITTHAAADPTNPRWDLVCVKLSDVSNDPADDESRLQKQVVGSSFVISAGTFVKRRKVTMQKQVVQGTPAGSPAIGAVPLGFQPLYAVLIPAAFASVFPVDDNFHDYRMPLGSFCVDMLASAGRKLSGTYTSDADLLDSWTMGTSTTVDFVPRIPVAASSCRLIGMSIIRNFSTAGFTISLGRYNVLNGGTYNQLGGNTHWILSALDALQASGTPDFKSVVERLGNQAGNKDPTAAIKPPWGTGRPSGYASRHEVPSLANIANLLGARFVTDGTGGHGLLNVKFHFAGGMF